MPRRYRRRARYAIARPLKTAKYSNETFGYYGIINNDSGVLGNRGSLVIPVVPPASPLGMRKVKNMTLRLCAEKTMITVGETSTFERARVMFALVYVPEGTNPSAINIGSAQNALSIYEPNQNVIMAGLVDSEQTYSFKTRLARNLNAGDMIYLILGDLTTTQVLGSTLQTPATVLLNYAIAF